MFRLVVPAIAAVLCLAGPAAAQTSVMFDHFKTLCANGEGDGERALMMGREFGWAQVPPGVLEGEADNPFKEVVALMNAEENGDISILMVGSVEESFEGAPMTMTVCAVMGGNFESGQPVKPDPRPFVRRWLGIDTHPALSTQGMTGYAFRKQNDAVVAVRPSEAAIMQSALNGDLHIVMVNDEDSQDGLSMVMYMRPRF